MLHDDAPRAWRPGGQTAILVHGLCGDHTSAYMARIASRLRHRGTRTFRMDLRGAGAAFLLSKNLYHSGLSDDIGAAANAVVRIAPGSPIDLIGFSLGGNLVLKYLGEGARQYSVLRNGVLERIPIRRAVAASPPADLAASLARLGSGFGNFYNRYFTRLLIKLVADHKRLVPGAPDAVFARTPRGIIEFDELYTAPRNGFSSAREYYESASSVKLLSKIDIPTLVIASRDDPCVDPSAFESLQRGAITPLLVNHGGHLGFLARRGTDPDRRWMDWRILDWLRQH